VQPIAPEPAPAEAPAPEPGAALAGEAPARSTPPAEASAGASDDNVIRRAADDGFVVFPVGRLQVDSYLFRTDNQAPNETFLIRRARVEVGGWIGNLAYFHLSGDFAGALPNVSSAPGGSSTFAATDNFIAVAPWRSVAMLQVGRFDAPFSLENRTRDTDLDFMERSLTVRALGIPDNKQVGAMVHGNNAARNFMYSAGVFNGDGPRFQNLDRQFDFMGRAWIAPLSFKGDGRLHDVTIGGSAWAGDRSNTIELPDQTTQGGFTFLSFAPYSGLNGNPGTPVQLRQVGRMTAFAGELNVPIDHRYGLRGEFVWKHSPLSQENVTNPGSGVIVGGAHLEGYAGYGELWFWALGDDRIIGDVQGLQPYPRTRRFGDGGAKNGLMLAFRFEYLNEDLTEESDSARLNLGNKYVGTTKVNSYALGINYWRSSRLRATFNYVFNHVTGDTAFIAGLASPNEQEFLFRLAIAL